MLNEYNTVRDPLVLKEYGRNVQKLVDYVQSLEDPEKKKSYAHALVELMKQINPTMREFNPEENQKPWDDLYIISNFKLDVEGPYPKPEPSILTARPLPMTYSTRIAKFKHYGYNVELLVQKAIEIEDPEEKEAAVIYIGRLMRSFSNIWNKENTDEEVIITNIKKLSKNQLDIDVDKVKQNNLFQPFYKERERERPRPTNSSGKNRNRSNSGKRRKN